jgi:hypothetical protein
VELFKSRKPNQPKSKECAACGASYTPGTGRGHEFEHIAEISETEPLWLPAHLRAVAQGEYTFQCGRCNSFPTMKWPTQGGAFSGMTMHLAVAHSTGMLASSGMGMRGSINFDMVPIRS